MKCLIMSILLLSLTIFGLMGQEQDVIPKWRLEASQDGSLPIARHEAAYVKVGDLFYLLGGRRIQAVSIYDPKSKEWSIGQEPPIELHHFQPIVWRGEIWVGGAFTGRYPAETPISHFYIYSPSKDQWRVGPEIPADRRRGSAGMVVYQDKIYMACGLTDGHRSGHRTWLDSYDPKTNEWQILPDAPRARDHFQASVALDRLYVLAGRRSKAPKNVFGDTEKAVDVFDFKQGQWSVLSDSLPTPRAGTFNVLWDNHILVIGGESNMQPKAHAEVEGLNLDTQTFDLFPSLPSGRHGAGVILWQKKLYVASGNATKGGGAESTDQFCMENVPAFGLWKHKK